MKLANRMSDYELRRELLSRVTTGEPQSADSTWLTRLAITAGLAILIYAVFWR